MLERTCMNKDLETQNNLCKTLEDPNDKTLFRDEMINTSIHSNNLNDEERIVRNNAITIIKKDNKLFINIDKDIIKLDSEDWGNKSRKERSLFNNNFTSIQPNYLKKKKRCENILDYDYFLHEVYSLPKEINVKKTVIKKLKNKVKNISVNKDVVKASNKKKNNSNAKNSSLYDLDNFIISSNTTKNICRQQHNNIKIFTPNFKDLEAKFFQASDHFSSTIYEKDFLFNDEEDISDEAYLKFHDEFERREKEYRMNFFKHKKQKSLSLKKVDYDDSNFNVSRFELNVTNTQNSLLTFENIQKI